MDWDAVSAIATVSATLVALGASVLAVKLPRIERRRFQAEATAEILYSTAEALRIFQEAKLLFAKAHWKDEKCAAVAARADHIRLALDRLLNRPELSDGAIVTGVGAMRLMEAIAAARDVVFAEDGTRFGIRSTAELMAVECMIPIVEDRAHGVASYAVNKRWNGWRVHFKPFADKALSGKTGSISE